MSAGFIDLLILAGTFSLITLGLDFVVGYSKIFSVNQAFMVAIGAFSYAFTANYINTDSILVAWALALVVSCTLSAIIGFASLRVRGDAFVVISFGAQIVGMQAIYNMTPISGGASGIFGLPTPTVFGWAPDTQLEMLLFVAGVVVLALLLTAFMVRSPWGMLLRAVGEEDVAVSAAGFDPRKIRVVAFMLGGSYAALAGPINVGYLGTAQVGDFSLTMSISLLAMVILGGAGRLLSGLAGAVIYVGVPYLLDFAHLPSATAAFVKQGIFGLALLLVVLFAPEGLIGAASLAWRRWRNGSDGSRNGPDRKESTAQ